mmetsp:Transcript_21048/g.31404  ORF Transcript_21048/g.31404 Transcript_21048/m.31404 type:complete len:87 (+) Transcript_21048:241-501(+)
MNDVFCRRSLDKTRERENLVNVHCAERWCPASSLKMCAMIVECEKMCISPACNSSLLPSPSNDCLGFFHFVVTDQEVHVRRSYLID